MLKKGIVICAIFVAIIFGAIKYSTEPQQEFIFVDSIQQMKKTSQKYVLTTDGMIYVYGDTKVNVPNYTNLVPSSTDLNGNIYNDGKGFKYGYRFNTVCDEVPASYSLISGFIPYNYEVIKIQADTYFAGNSANYVKLFDESFEKLTASNNLQASFTFWIQSGATYEKINNHIVLTIDPAKITGELADILAETKYIAASVGTSIHNETNADHFVITLNDPLEYTIAETKTWYSTGELYNSTPPTPILVPDYWEMHLKDKSYEIQQAMDIAGNNKSAFLWYTDAHWDNGSAKISPKLLTYLIQTTDMDKINFGGDIVGDSLKDTLKEMNYINEWREAIKHLPNHHSVIGNHDNFRRDDVTYDDNNFAYNFLIAPEESSDMVKGDDFYYYIDNADEKTRYLYLDSGKYELSDNEAKFVIDALTNTPEGWHIIAISHIWFEYNAPSEPTVGKLNSSSKRILSLFDAYNSRQSGTITMKKTSHEYDFSDCSGKVEFCIGGHIHYQYVLYSDGGIPVILTPPDANQVRGGDSSAYYTTTEASVCGVIADYTNKKINLIFVGRGADIQIPIS